MRALRLVLTVLGTALSFTADASELALARKDAEAGTASLEQRPCPSLGDRNYLGGFTSVQQLVAAADRERTYVDGAQAQLQQIVRDPKLSERQRTELRGLASWSIVASMASWSMLQVAQQALADPLVVQGRPSPASTIESAQVQLNQLGSNGAMSPDAANALRRLSSALERCSKNFNAQIFQLNQPQLEAAIESAGSMGDLNRLEQLYRVREAALAGYGADLPDKLAARRATLTEAERVAREAAAQANAVETAKRQAEAAKRQAELNARLGTQLLVAQRFAEAAQSGDERSALADLAPDIVMSTPQGTYRGIDQVVAAVRRQTASGGGSLGTPRIEGSRIVAYGSFGGFRITTVFSINDGNRIARMDIGL